MKIVKLLSLISLLLLVTNCASIVDGSNQVISINSNVQGADVYINGIMVGKTPFSGQVKKQKDTQVRIQKKGYTSQTLLMSTSLPTAFWGNIITGGFLGSTTDYATGAAYEYAPNNYFLHIEKENADSEEKAQSAKSREIAKFVLINRNQLVNEIYRGQGEYLDALLKLKGKDQNRHEYISELQSLVVIDPGSISLAINLSK